MQAYKTVRIQACTHSLQYCTFFRFRAIRLSEYQISPVVIFEKNTLFQDLFLLLKFILDASKFGKLCGFMYNLGFNTYLIHHINKRESNLLNFIVYTYILTWIGNTWVLLVYTYIKTAYNWVNLIYYD